MNRLKIGIIGDGGWGTTLSLVLCDKGHSTVVWSPFADYADKVDKTRENIKFLPGVKITGGIKFTGDKQLLSGCDLYVISIPCQYLRTTLGTLASVIKGPAVSVVKGIETSTLETPSDIIRQTFKKIELTVLSGPTIAYEIARKMPATCVAAADDIKLAERVQDEFSNEYFRVYRSTDMIGVELAGALKNVIAIAAGISDGMGLGVNAKAGILTRGLAEIARLGVKMGAKLETFYGLSGVGDLATTCMSAHSRNRWLGEEIGKGRKSADILADTSMVVEGAATSEAAYKLSNKVGVSMPITETVYRIIYENKNPRDAVRELMTRSPKAEHY